MGLAASQVRLLGLTARKADCEHRISKNATEKMALTREQSNLAREYQMKLNSKNLAYYSNGSYYKLDYTYLMGKPYYTKYVDNEDYTKKQNYDMVLTDANGLVVIAGDYVRRFADAGVNIDTASGKGKPFSADKMYEILSLCTDTKKVLLKLSLMVKK